MFNGLLNLYGDSHENVYASLINLVQQLITMGGYAEASSLVREYSPKCERALGAGRATVVLKCLGARALFEVPGATREDITSAVTILEEQHRAARRLLGASHPNALFAKTQLDKAQAKLAAGGEVFQTADDIAAFFG